MPEVILHKSYVMPDGTEREHVYTVDGVVLPGCSDILAASGYENPWLERFKRASTFGDALHFAIRLEFEDKLEGIDQHEQFQNAFAAFRQWCEDYDPEVIHCEKPLYSERHGYCGTPDLICRIKKRLSIPDWKSGAYNNGVSQLKMDAYEVLVRENLNVPASAKVDKFLVLLSCEKPKLGKRYKIVTMNDPLAGIAWQSCLNIYRWKQKG